MLASCSFMALLEAIERRSIPIQHIVILACLGLMGLRLPNSTPAIEALYTAIEIGLIFFGTTLGYLHILPTLYLIVVIRSCLLFEMPGRLAVAGLSFILYLVHQVQYVQSITQLMLPQMQMQRVWMHQIAEILMFALGLFFVLQLVSTLLAERQTRSQLVIAHEQLQQYAQQVEEFAAVQERNRIARDIHDSLGHALTALNVQLQTTARLWQVNPEKAKSFFNQAQRLGELAIKEVRQSVRALQADARESQPLEQVIESLVQDFRQGTGIQTYTSIDLHWRLPSQTLKAIYRIVQEALTNICKHAEATQVRIQLSDTSNTVCLAIEDNGSGFELDQDPNGFGLRSMQERAAALKGFCYIASQPGAGCRITVELPIPTDARNISVNLLQYIRQQKPSHRLEQDFLRRCEQELAILVGPIASALIQRVLKSDPQISAAELVRTLAAEIPAPQKAAEFQQRLLS